jgi:bifunctional non-homologous end joining protein LigD
MNPQAVAMSLKEYIRKRDFKQTREPKGLLQPTKPRQRFVIQKHAASRLHYDFRLEMDGALKSWAVPKGVPFAKGEKRLAVEVEDHPISYIDFEGTIPKGQYGGGTVMVWDRGTFEPLGDSPARELAGGKLHFRLHGQKLDGEWYLVRLRQGKQWLLIKGGTDARPVSAKLDATSALSGKSMKQLGNGDHVWQSNDAPGTKTKPAKKPARSKPAAAPAIAFVEPMKARLVDSPPSGNWVYEIKFDGFRALALKDGQKTSLLSRTENDLSQKFPEVTEAVGRLKTESAIVDGEIVALDPQGRSSFQLLQAYDLGQERPPIMFYAFDLLQLNGNNLRGEPLTVRKRELEKLLKKPPGVIRYSASLGGRPEDLLKQAQKLGLEGLIGKRADSPYESGRRSGAWVKLKLHHEQEMVIGGYTNPEGGRSHFGALLIGYYEKDKLYCAGKVGTGFNETLLKTLHDRLTGLSQTECPFVNLPEKRAGRYGAGVTPAEMKRCHWVSPQLVVQVKFSEWTRDGKLRQPVFLGLREDKKAREVTREEPA